MMRTASAFKLCLTNIRACLPKIIGNEIVLLLKKAWYATVFMIIIKESLINECISWQESS